MTTETFDYSDQSAAAARRAASIAAEAIRFMNHATIPPAKGLEYPADVDTVITELESLAVRLPQLLAQLSGWLSAEVAADRVRVTNGTLTRSLAAEAMVAAEVRQFFTEAGIHADGLREALHDARQLTSTLAPAGEDQ